MFSRNLKRARQPFALRIILAFTLMTFVVNGLMFLSLVYAAHVFEEELVSRALHKTLTHILDKDLPAGHALHLDQDTHFFAPDQSEYAMPEQFAQAEAGLSEVVAQNTAYYVYVLETGGQRYLLAQDQGKFEQREETLFNTLFAGFLLSVVAAWGLGRLTAKKIMAPIIHLAQAVRQTETEPLTTTPMARNYADDEIGHLARAFDNALSRLGNALERERLFTSDVSHELRTPLTIISTSCELLTSADLSLRAREKVERIARATEEIRGLTETFLLLARGKAAQSGLTVCALALIAEEQYARWLPALRAKGLAFEMRTACQNSAQTTQYNAVLLRAVMSNLLRNAWYYTERGWVRLVLEDGGFRVEDSGIGISEHEKEFVFHAFTRGKQACGEGLGLGLSLVKRICESQGWTITLERLSMEGGSRFRVNLSDFPDFSHPFNKHLKVRD
jgi:signal transduction histidine kinase